MNFDPKEIHDVREITLDIQGEQIIGRRIVFANDTGGKDLFYIDDANNRLLADVAEELDDEDLKTTVRDELLRRMNRG